MFHFLRSHKTPLEPRPLAADDPRRETPEQAAARLQHLERSRDAVRAKITRAFAADFNPNPRQQRFFDMVSSEITHMWAKHSAPQMELDRNPAQFAKIQEAMHVCARDYLTAFQLLHTLDGTPAAQPGYEGYSKNHTGTYLYQTYANHVANAAEARFIACGVDALLAHRLNGSVIRQAVEAAHETIADDPYISPGQKRPSSEIEALTQIERLRHYWKFSAAGLGWKPPSR